MVFLYLKFLYYNLFLTVHLPLNSGDVSVVIMPELALYHFQVYFRQMKLNFSLLWLNFRLLQLNLRLLQLNFSLMQYYFSLMQYNFGQVKFNFRIANYLPITFQRQNWMLSEHTLFRTLLVVSAIYTRKLIYFCVNEIK